MWPSNNAHETSFTKTESWGKKQADPDEKLLNLRELGGSGMSPINKK